MPEVDFILMQRTLDDFYQNRTIPLVEIANQYSVEELIRAFNKGRDQMATIVSDLTDDQINYSPDPESFSLSEVISHVMYAQGGVYNALLELSLVVMPHADHVHSGPGGGAQKNLSADKTRKLLAEGTEELVDLMRQVARIENLAPKAHDFFGQMNFKSWILYQLGHDLEHVNQSQTLRQSLTFPTT